MRQVDLAGAAHLELVSGVVQLRPEDAQLIYQHSLGWPAALQLVAIGLNRSPRRGSTTPAVLTDLSGDVDSAAARICRRASHASGFHQKRLVTKKANTPVKPSRRTR